MENKRFYVTTPIYYPSEKLHIGHALTTTMADTLARWKRLQGYDVWFLTGSDEHGQKIQRRATEEGVEPIDYVNPIVDAFQELWKRLSISYDDFIRTTEERHKVVVQEIFRRIYEKGDIYKSEYEGWYCTPCETFWTERQLQDSNCPDCGRPVELVKEESYFFRMSKYADQLLAYFDENPEFIQPGARRNEMISFIKGGLEDLCVSRTTFNWGIPVPIDDKHVIYVWFDALTNYVSALGYGNGDPKFEKFWPVVTHLVGKDIVRFHTVIWPIILMAAGIAPPKRVYGHGWLLVEGGKMSKSKGNVVDPMVLIDRYGSDSVRYFLLREMSYGADGYYSEEALVRRLNSDLANDYGNLLNRTHSMLERYLGGVIPQPMEEVLPDGDLKEIARKVPGEVETALERFEFSAGLAAIWRLISRANKYLDETAPWSLAADENKKGRIQTVLYNSLEAVRVATVLLTPFMPNTPPRVWRQLGVDGCDDIQSWAAAGKWGLLPVGQRVNQGEPLFPRIEFSEADSNDGEVKKYNLRKLQDGTSKGPVEVGEEVEKKAAGEKSAELVEIEEFARLDLRVCEVLTASRIKKADRLLQLTVRLDEGERTVVAGIAQHYTPEELVGKKVVLVANLRPTKIKGLESQGMILAAVDGGKLALLSPDRDVSPGSKVR